MNIYDVQSKAQGLPDKIKAWELLFEYARAEAGRDVESAEGMGVGSLGLSEGVGFVLLVDRQVRENALQQARSGVDAQRWIDLYWKAMLHIAQLDFDLDAFMLYMEKDRAPNARFWAPRRSVLEGKHHIASALSGFVKGNDKRFLGLSLPPGCGKTTMIKFLLAYIAGKFPKSMNMYISYSDGMVKLMLDALRDMTSNANDYKFADIFPSLGAPAISSEYSTVSYRSKGDAPTIGLCSVGGSVTGRTRANKFQITDDLVKNAEVARSPSRLETLNQDWLSTITTRTIGDDVKEIMLGTIWSAHDPLSRQRAENDRKGSHIFITIPVWDCNENSNFAFDHPDGYTPQKIRDIRDKIDPVDFSCLYLQRPIEKEGLAFAADTLKYYAGVLPDGEPDNILFYNDVAWGGGDYLSMPICYQFGTRGYIHDWLFSKENKHITKPRVVGKILQHQIRMGQFEANNGGDEYCEDVDRKLRENHGYSCNLGHKKASSDKSKMARIEQFAPDIRELYFIDDASPPAQRNAYEPQRVYRDDDYKSAMNNLTSFSFTAKNANDDAPDSLAGLCDYFLNRHNSKVEVFKRIF